AALSLFHQGRRHLAVEMRIAPGLIVESVEDGEGGWPLLNGEPRDRAHFSVHQGDGGTQKILDLFLFARLLLQRNIQSKICHRRLSFDRASGSKTCKHAFETGKV